ncbi:MAG: ACP S-malonyltransferase [Maricaulaceae bacterium]|jgi:[acyl-carrier-protein] S-malonyltransferase
MTLAFLFPGQGSQSPGMAKAIADASSAARAVLDEIDDALGQKLSNLMFEGPGDELTLTENAQPALMAASLAVMASLKADHGVEVTAASYVAGHSLGEYSALAAAGALTIADAARLLRVRGRAMQAAVPVGEGAMAALLGAEMNQVLDACAVARSKGVCDIANDNAPGQIVISGAKEAVEAAIAAVRELGVRKAMLLPVSAPFHCALMQPAAEVMSEALETAAINAPKVPVVANVSAEPTDDPETIRNQLVAQVTGRVRWRESIAFMADAGVTRMAEAGAGKVLTGMLKRAAPDVEEIALNGPEDLAAFAGALEGAS